MIATYARCSTTDQDLEAQRHQLQEYAERRGAEALAFEDHGVSGARATRPGLDALMRAVRRREVEAVVVTRLDRLGRSAAHLASVADEMRSVGVALVCLDLGLDTSTPQGALVLHVLGAVAQFERQLIVERVREGMAAAKRRGKHVGRPRALDRRGRERLRRLRRSGKSLRACAALLGVGLATCSREARLMA